VKGWGAHVAFSLLAVFDAEGCLNVSWTARVVVKVEPVNNVSFLVLFSLSFVERKEILRYRRTKLDSTHTGSARF